MLLKNNEIELPDNISPNMVADVQLAPVTSVYAERYFRICE